MKRLTMIMVLILAVGQMYSQTDQDYTNWLIQDKLLAEPWVPVNHSQTEQLLQMKLWDDLYSPDPYIQAVQDYQVVVVPVYAPPIIQQVYNAPVGIPAGYYNEAVVDELMWEKIVIISDLKDEIVWLKGEIEVWKAHCQIRESIFKLHTKDLERQLEECRVNK